MVNVDRQGIWRRQVHHCGGTYYDLGGPGSVTWDGLAMIWCDMGMIWGVFDRHPGRFGFFLAWPGVPGPWSRLIWEFVCFVICCDLLVAWDGLVVGRGDLGSLWIHPGLG